MTDLDLHPGQVVEAMQGAESVLVTVVSNDERQTRDARGGLVPRAVGKRREESSERPQRRSRH